MYLKNKINFAKAILSANLFNKRTPLNVTWWITDLCNARCSYCRVPQRKQIEPTTEQVLDLIEQMKLAGTQRIGFSGGEPLLREDIEKIIESCKENNIYVTLITNGYLVPEKINLLKKLDYLFISFDGPKEIHEKNREKGSFKKVYKALKMAPKFCPVITHTVFTKHNLNSIDYILNLAKKYGFQTTFSPLHGSMDISPTNKEYEYVFTKLLERKKQRYPVAISSAALRFYLKWGHFSTFTKEKNYKGFLKCWGGKLSCNIDVDGTIAPCCYTKDKSSSNVFKIGFKEAFDRLNENLCKSCINSTPLIEYNLIFSLNLRAIYDWIKIVNFSRRRKNGYQN